MSGVKNMIPYHSDACMILVDSVSTSIKSHWGETRNDDDWDTATGSTKW